MNLTQPVSPEAVGVRVPDPAKRNAALEKRANKIQARVNLIIMGLRDVGVPIQAADQMVQNVLWSHLAEIMPVDRACLYGE